MKTVFLSSSKLSGVLCSSCTSLGQLSLSCESHSGPSHHSFDSFNFVAADPRDLISARCSSPRQWPHSDLFVNLSISLSLCCTNFFHSLLFRIQQKAVLLSNQSFLPVNFNWNCKALTAKLGNCTKGIVNSFRGATLYLLANILTLREPF